MTVHTDVLVVLVVLVVVVVVLVAFLVEHALVRATSALVPTLCLDVKSTSVETGRDMARTSACSTSR